MEVKKGDVLGAVFRKAKVDAVTMQAILDSGKDAKTLTRLFPGEQLEFGSGCRRLLTRIALHHQRLKDVTRATSG